MTYAIRYIVVLVVLLALDALWLGYFARAMFRTTLGAALLDTPRWVAAGLFYLLYALGVVIFAVAPAMRTGSAVTAALYGAAFGFFAYMTYDLTNLATLKTWTTPLALIDIAWGALLTGAGSLASYEAGNWFASR